MKSAVANAKQVANLLAKPLAPLVIKHALKKKRSIRPSRTKTNFLIYNGSYFHI